MNCEQTKNKGHKLLKRGKFLLIYKKSCYEDSIVLFKIYNNEL